MNYSGYKLRRQILADTEMTDFGRRLSLIVVEHVDWSTGQKKFHSKSHMENWLKSLAEQYGIKTTTEDGTETNGATWLYTAVVYLTSNGYATLDKSTGEFALTQKPDWGDEEEEAG